MEEEKKQSIQNIQSILIETQYWGSIDYFRLMAKHPAIVIEQYEHFVKASFRNRCHIATPNGLLVLSVPIKSGRNIRKITKDVEIFYEMPWQKLHWQSLCSAYRRSPYFEYYEDELQPFYEKKYKFLLDYNMAQLEWLNDTLELEFAHSLNTSYIDTDKIDSETIKDGRSVILPSEKKTRNPFKDEPVKYHQVFENKTGFLHNMSILDLLFCEGPNTNSFIQ